MGSSVLCLPEFAQTSCPLSWWMPSNISSLCCPLVLLPSVFQDLEYWTENENQNGCLWVENGCPCDCSSLFPVWLCVADWEPTQNHSRLLYHILLALEKITIQNLKYDFTERTLSLCHCNVKNGEVQSSVMLKIIATITIVIILIEILYAMLSSSCVPTNWSEVKDTQSCPSL